jgi:hypothetical protein
MKIIQTVNVKRRPIYFYYIFLYKIYVLKCLRTAQVQAETCSIQVRVINLIKINVCCFRLNRCGLFSNIYNEVASTKTKYTNVLSSSRQNSDSSTFSCENRLRHLNVRSLKHNI